MTLIVISVQRLLQFWESFTMNVLQLVLYAILFVPVKCEISAVESRLCDFVRENVISAIFKVRLFKKYVAI